MKFSIFHLDPVVENNRVFCFCRDENGTYHKIPFGEVQRSLFAVDHITGFHRPITTLLGVETKIWAMFLKEYLKENRPFPPTKEDIEEFLKCRNIMTDVSGDRAPKLPL